MNEQLPPVQEVTLTSPDVSSNDIPNLEKRRKESPPIPWIVYFVSYFLQGIIMPMILIHIPVYFVKGLGLDWITVTAVFVVIIIPVFLRPVFAIITDRRPKMLSPMLIIGGSLITVGCIIAGLSALEGFSGLLPFTIGFSAGVAGAIIFNVVTDSHIVRAISLDRSSKVNSFKKVFSFIGGALVPISYVFTVGNNFTDYFAWAAYFSLPAIIGVVVLILIVAQRSIWKTLSEVTGLPPLRASWLGNNIVDSNLVKKKIFPMIILAAIMFLFFFPDGLFETTWENFIIESYKGEAWSVYNLTMIPFGIVSILGFVLARRSGKKVPEWGLVWYTPLMLGYYLLVLNNPPFPVFLLVSLGFQFPSAFIQVRILQSIQSHSYSKKAGQTFQVFMVMLQGGKIVGISISGAVMIIGGYAAIFYATILIVLVMLSFVFVYWVITGSSRSRSSQKNIK